ncbi:sugar efflux transporter [Pseudoalteromonas sp. SR41-4]|uniref:sugar efflux transporter n=1 Tax=Pseudoalteromonas sp. SR41-4 TaxID=2760950 RepID=UPI0021757EDA|nr:sugar efflux transporter [Pseudoalteromonas sp. SR41-4]
MKSIFKQYGVVFILLSLLTGLIGAFVNPLMSLFIVEGLQSPPIYLGVYTTGVTLMGILGGLADKGVSAKKMFMIAVSGMGMALIIFANATSFWQVFAAGVLLLSMGNAAIPQVMTIARQWADEQDHIDITQFNTRLRAAISFTWVAGPPLGYLLASGVAFSRSFYTAATFALLALIFAMKFLPSVNANDKAKKAEPNQPINQSFWALGAAITFGSIGNIMYASALPLYTINELGFANNMPGIFMGMVALIEIPVMLYSAKLSKRITKTGLLGFAFSCAILFYIGVFFSDQVWQFFVLQGVNAIFYGIFAGIGLTILQEQLPSRIGFTSAFYGNAIKVGVMLGTASTGLIAQWFSFRFATLGSLIAASIAMTFLIIFSYLKRQESESQEPIFAQNVI